MQTIVHMGVDEKYFRPEINSISGAYGRYRGITQRCQTFVGVNEENYRIRLTKGITIFVCSVRKLEEL